MCVQNRDKKEGYIPELHVNPHIIMGNALVLNTDDKAYIKCVNTSKKVIELETPVVELLDYEKETEKDEDYWDSDLEADIDMLSHQIMQK